jgi:hypothetical protein
MKVVLWMLGVCALLYAQVLSEWAFEGPDHRLHYRTDARLNSIMDFSTAGYRGGGVKLPSPAAAQRLTPAPGDNTARIQAALDSATGAVVLAPGEYEVAGTLTINRSGVVLRGEKGASIRLTGPPHTLLEIRGSGIWHEEGPPAPVLDDYVPAGLATFRVRGAEAFHDGDRVLVLRPVTAQWLHFMGLDATAGNHRPQCWLHAGGVIRTDRTIEHVEGDHIILDASLSDDLDSKFTAASLVRYSFPGRIAEAGVEGLRVTAPPENPQTAGPHFTALSMDAVEDAWVRDLELHDTQDGIVFGPTARRITLANVRIAHSAGHAGTVDPADFVLRGTQILLDRCSVTGEASHPAVTDADAIGPLVLLNFTADHGGFSPRQPWATGVLVDGGKFPGATERNPGVAFSSRAAGSGRGWDIGWSVAWNVVSPFVRMPQPPGAMNWCTGCIGTPVPVPGTANAIFDSPGKMVEPPSLYLHQLRDRIGPDALRDIGYR